MTLQTPSVAVAPTPQRAETPPSPPAIASAPAVAPSRPPGDRAAAAESRAGRIMVVDDEPINIKIVGKYLKQAGHAAPVSVSDPARALETALNERPDVLLLDVVMPDISGLQILEQMRQQPALAHTPVLILTATADAATRHKALELGATDFLAKPVEATELVARVRNALVVKAHQDQLHDYAQQLEMDVRRRTEEVTRTRLEVVHCLARAAEFRDNETGRHVIRVGRYAGVIARQLGLDAHMVEQIEMAAPLHDVGKIGVPDEILLKPGKLTPEEYETMHKHAALGKSVFERMGDEEAARARRHTDIGSKIIGEPRFDLLRMAGRIALTHHEKWDGSGYPLGLAGEDIPLEGRITAAADVYDALSSKRPYKPAFPRAKCFDIMEEGRHTHFDPAVLDAFFARTQEIIDIQIEHLDPV